MILDIVRGDVLAGDAPVIFAVNYEGFNDAGFAGVVARRFWPGVESLGRSLPGQVHRHTTADRDFFAVACHGLQSGEWDMEAITAGLDLIAGQMQKAPTAFWPVSLEQAHRERHRMPGAVWMGRGLVGGLTGVDPNQVLAAMAQSRLPLNVYYL